MLHLFIGLGYVRLHGWLRSASDPQGRACSDIPSRGSRYAGVPDPWRLDRQRPRRRTRPGEGAGTRVGARGGTRQSAAMRRQRIPLVHAGCSRMSEPPPRQDLAPRGSIRSRRYTGGHGEDTAARSRGRRDGGERTATGARERAWGGTESRVVVVEGVFRDNAPGEASRGTRRVRCGSRCDRLPPRSINASLDTRVTNHRRRSHRAGPSVDGGGTRRPQAL
mmetsp:Transcript_56440/g.122747  ORF Transcript_56440/g.122747 Transcript_56440/m.122747 type:complete len:221 (-) Transcript_56440:459-1121(-)